MATDNHDAVPTIRDLEPLVEVNYIASQQLRIHVECRKRFGLLGDILAAVEKAGLLLQEAEISIHENIINLDVVGVQEELLALPVDATVLRSSLLDVITNATNSEALDTIQPDSPLP